MPVWHDFSVLAGRLNCNVLQRRITPQEPHWHTVINAKKLPPPPPLPSPPLLVCSVSFHILLHQNDTPCVLCTYDGEIAPGFNSKDYSQACGRPFTFVLLLLLVPEPGWGLLRLESLQTTTSWRSLLWVVDQKKRTDDVLGGQWLIPLAGSTRVACVCNSPAVPQVSRNKTSSAFYLPTTTPLAAGDFCPLFVCFFTLSRWALSCTCPVSKKPIFLRNVCLFSLFLRL